MTASTRWKSLLILLLSCCLPALFAAEPDSLKIQKDSTLVFFFYHDIDREGTLPLHAYDTAVTGTENYNPLYQSGRFFATLGNIGSMYRTLFPCPFWQTGGFDYGIHSFDHYLFLNDSVKYYKVVKTFTDLKYIQGAKKELNFQAKFSRNLYRNLNLGFDFHVSNSPGAYLRQKTNIINFVVTTQFFSKTKQYGAVANFLVNRIKNQENGGITYDSLFEQNIEPNRQVIPVNLTAAQNQINEYGFYMKHCFDLTRHDRLRTDSAWIHTKRIELGRITYTFQFTRQIQKYSDTDADTGFYAQNHLVDSVNTLDSLVIKKVINELSWTNPSFDPLKQFRTLQLEGKIKQQYIEVGSHGRKFFLTQVIPSGYISFRPFRTLAITAYVDYVLGNYNEGDITGMASVSQILGRATKNFGTITLTGHYKYQKPGWFYAHYAGNNFEWDTTWKKQGLISVSAMYSWKFIQAGANMSRLTNYVYLDASAHPRQESNQIGYLCAWLNTDIDIWRFKFKGQFAYQSIQGSSVIRLPAFVGNLTIYFTQPLFKGAATIQPGLNFFYNTRYYADSYMPATRMFYLQDQREIGNYLYMDVFLNVKIQRARIFVTYSHFNASFMGREYYMVPHYPMQDGAFKFGISWHFHD